MLNAFAHPPSKGDLKKPDSENRNRVQHQHAGRNFSEANRQLDINQKITNK